MSTNENATYTAAVNADNIVITAKSAQDVSNTVVVTIDTNGKLGTWSYGGAFQ